MQLDLHDIGRWRQYETGEDHSIIGAEMAEEILGRAVFSPQEIGSSPGDQRAQRAETGMSLLGNCCTGQITFPVPAISAVPKRNATNSPQWKQAT